jgi:hypothetical protein
MKYLARTLSYFLLVAAFPIAAQNLVQNGTFDTNVTHWAFGAFSNVDANGSQSSGSVLKVNASETAGTSMPVASDCFAVVGGASYERSVDYRYSGEPGYVALYTIWYSEPDCKGGTAGPSTPASLGDGQWHSISSTLTAPVNAKSAVLWLQVYKTPPGSSITANFDNAVFKPQGTCVPLPTVMCLNENRFGVAARWTTATQSGNAFATKLTNDSGYLWFFSSENIETVVKILNGCGVNGRYWFFSGGLTDQGVDITVTDTKNGTTRTYNSLRGSAFQPIQDTSAFATCP